MTKPVNVWMPWRPHPSRIPAFAFCVDWWTQNGFVVHTIDSGDEPFSLAGSRNEAVRSSTEVLVIADADTVGQVESIRQAIHLAMTENRTVLPFTNCRVLSDSGTRQALDGTELENCSHFLQNPPSVGGMYVTRPEVWFSYGGQDARFKGWLGEDVAHHCAHETLLGPIVRTNGNIYTLGHEYALKSGPQYEMNRLLMECYGSACGDPIAMRALIAERGDVAESSSCRSGHSEETSRSTSLRPSPTPRANPVRALRRGRRP